ncbi:11708_t:CDS:2, partial [Scutellospora calospora]
SGEHQMFKQIIAIRANTLIRDMKETALRAHNPKIIGSNSTSQPYRSSVSLDYNIRAKYTFPAKENKT